MSRLTLDLDQLAVTTFEPSVAYDSSSTNESLSCDCNTLDYGCMALSLLAEDCIGPSAGCTIGTEA